jgi:hypothetical protein
MLCKVHLEGFTPAEKEILDMTFFHPYDRGKLQKLQICSLCGSKNTAASGKFCIRRKTRVIV